MACPNREQLLAFHLGDLADTDIASVGAHLSECTRCEQLARQLDGLSDQILAALRRAAAPAADLSARATRGVYPALLVPSVPAPEIPGYDALELVGRGAMSLVYKARHRKLDRLVAIKCLRADGARDLGRFRSEAEAIARLQHPNIVQIFEVGERQGQPFMTLEFLDGGTLADHLNGKPQDARASAALVQTLARAVHYAHSRGIVHRDLKPANILVEASDEGRGASPMASEVGNGPAPLVPRLSSLVPKISDFGIAKHLPTSGQTREGDIIGTACYMAPEQAAGKAADIA